MFEQFIACCTLLALLALIGVLDWIRRIVKEMYFEVVHLGVHICQAAEDMHEDVENEIEVENKDDE